MEFKCLQCGDEYTPDDSPSDLYCSQSCNDDWVYTASLEVISDDYTLDSEARAARHRAEQTGEAVPFNLMGYGSDSYSAGFTDEEQHTRPRVHPQMVPQTPLRGLWVVQADLEDENIDRLPADEYFANRIESPRTPRVYITTSEIPTGVSVDLEPDTSGFEYLRVTLDEQELPGSWSATFHSHHE